MTLPPDVSAQPVAQRDIDDLPGPRRWPLVGNAFQVRRDQIHLNIEAWGREFGPLFRVKLGPRTMLVVSDHRVLNTMLRDRPDVFQRAPLLQTIGMEMGLQPGLFGSNGEAWRRQRRMVVAGLAPNHVKSYFPSLLRVTQRLRGRWQGATQGGQSIELQHDLMRFTVDAIAGLAFGADINTLESDEDVIQQHLDKIFPAYFKRLFSLFPLWRFIKRSADRQLDSSVVAVNVAITGFIQAARARLAADPARRAQPPNLLEAMIVAAEADEAGPHDNTNGNGNGNGNSNANGNASPGPASRVTDREVAGNVLTMLLAGEDTTANALAWMIYLLHRNPQTLQRATQEVRALGVDSSAFTLQAMASLTYLEACAHEAMRLKPVAPFQIIEAVHDTVVADVRVPRGTRVWCLMRGDSISAAHFPDPDRFEPQRWLHDSAAGANAAPNPSAAHRISMPFGAGPRVCPGRYLALLEIKMAMAMLLNHFDIDTVTTPDGGEAVEKMAFTMLPVDLKMRLRARPLD